MPDRVRVEPAVAPMVRLRSITLRGIAARTEVVVSPERNTILEYPLREHCSQSAMRHVLLNDAKSSTSGDPLSQFIGKRRQANRHFAHHPQIRTASAERGQHAQYRTRQRPGDDHDQAVASGEAAPWS